MKEHKDLLRQTERLAEQLAIRPGVTALVGGGGKTTLMRRLAAELSAHGRVLVTTTTHIWPYDDLPLLLDPDEDGIAAAFQNASAVCAGSRSENGKLTACRVPAERLMMLCDYVLLEADGAKCLPLKAPAAHEPVIPACAGCVVAVAGMDGVGRAIRDTAFRPALYAGLLGVDEAHVITPADAAAVLTSPLGQRKGVLPGMRFCIVLNKADDAERLQAANALVRAMDPGGVDRVLITSLKERDPIC